MQMKLLIDVVTNYLNASKTIMTRRSIAGLVQQVALLSWLEDEDEGEEEEEEETDDESKQEEWEISEQLL